MFAAIKDDVQNLIEQNADLRTYNDTIASVQTLVTDMQETLDQYRKALEDIRNDNGKTTISENKESNLQHVRRSLADKVFLPSYANWQFNVAGANLKRGEFAKVFAYLPSLPTLLSLQVLISQDYYA
jgi:regulator of replication initiation timing